MKEQTLGWTRQQYKVLWKQLKLEKEESYRHFSEKIIQTNYPMLGIRTPLLRKQVSKIAKRGISSYLEISENTYYEEVLMKGFVLGKILDKETLKQEFLNFVPLIDNWAICDMTVASLKQISKDKAYFLELVDTLLASKEEFKIRSGFVILLNYYVEDSFLEEIFLRILQVTTDAYYVQMAKAWLLCECFLANPKKTFTFLEKAPLSFSLLSKTIQKVCDSYRATAHQKQKLKALRHQKKEGLYS